MTPGHMIHFIKSNYGYHMFIILYYIFRPERCTYLHMMLSQVFSLHAPSLEFKDEVKENTDRGGRRKPKGDLFDEVRVYRAFK